MYDPGLKPRTKKSLVTTNSTTRRPFTRLSPASLEATSIDCDGLRTMDVAFNEADARRVKTIRDFLKQAGFTFLMGALGAKVQSGANKNFLHPETNKTTRRMWLRADSETWRDFDPQDEEPTCIEAFNSGERVEFLTVCRGNLGRLRAASAGDLLYTSDLKDTIMKYYVDKYNVTEAHVSQFFILRTKS